LGSKPAAVSNGGLAYRSLLTLQGQVLDFETLVSTLLRGDDWRIADEWVVDTWVRDEVRLELIQVDIEGTIESQAGGDRADHLGDEAVQMSVVGSRNVQVATTDVIHGLVVDQERAVGVLNGAVSGEDSIVGLDDRGGDAWCGVDSKLEL